MSYRAFEHLQIGVIVIDHFTDKILYVNQWVKNITGCRQDDLAALCWQQFILTKDLAGMSDEIDRQLAEKQWFQTDCNAFIDGRMMWFDVRANYDVTEENRQTLCVTLTDITEVKKAQKELNHINESIPGGLVILNTDEYFTIDYANSGYYKMIGYTALELYEKYKNRTSLTVYAEDFEPAVKVLHHQLEEGSKFHIEARVIRKNNTLIWVSFDGIYVSGENKLYCVLVDISEQKNIIISLRQEKMLNQIIFGLSSDILFNLDLKKNTVIHSENVLDFFDLEPAAQNFPECILDAKIILEADLPDFLALVKAVYDGKKVNTELHLRNKFGEINWYHMVYDFLYDNDGNAMKAVGKIVNVNSRKLLERKASLDSLTHLYNKTETEKNIEKCIASYQGKKQYAFLIVDIDNFKRVNDTLGHHFGDTVLVDIAAKISAQFRDNDIVGRIGGDEFAVFLCGISSREIAAEKAEQLTNVFRHTFSGENKDYKISGSIGISLFPQNGSTYEELYKKADIALYESKRKGKDCYTFYSEQMNQCTVSSLNPFEESRHGTSEYFEGHLLYAIFDLLYETKDIYASINKALEIVGREFGVDRCYIFEAAEDGKSYNNTYEWCEKGVASAMAELQGLSRISLDCVFAQYNEEGIFYCNNVTNIKGEIYDLLEKQGIISMLHCALYVDDDIRVIVGFDECKKQRNWSGKEIAVLSYLSKLLGIYLINKGISTDLKEISQNKNMLLDNMNGYNIVINCDTFELLFLNQMAKNIVTNAQCGDKCYKAVFGIDTPCENCPAKMLQKKENATLELYNPNYNLWVLATASKVNWIGCKNAALISCIDVTGYKYLTKESQDKNE